MRDSNLFDEVASIGKKFLLSTDRGHTMLSNYAWQLGSICDLIEHTHLIVIKKLEAIGKAETLEDAKAIVQELRRESLTESFRANGLCDLFQGYGGSLRRIVEKNQDSTDPESALPITQDEQSIWLEFCDELEEREARVAGLYKDTIQSFRDLVNQDLEKFKEQAQQARSILIAQVADFHALAESFRKRIKV